MRLYLDSCAIIYAVEGEAGLREKALKWIDGAEATTTGRVVTSRLSFLECRVNPLRAKDASRLVEFERFLTRASFEFWEVSPGVIDRATQVRADLNLKTADAIHVASAIESRSDVLLSRDGDMLRCSHLIRVETLS